MHSAKPLPSIEALTAPAVDVSHPVYGDLIFVKTVLDDSHHAEVLDKRCNWLKPSPLNDALWAGRCALEQRVRDDVRNGVKPSGHLLLCWPGTTVFKGAA